MGRVVNSSGISTSTPYLLSLTTPGFIYVNGTKGGAVNAATINDDRFWLMSLSNSKYTTGRIGRKIMFRGVLSDVDRHAVEAYLASIFDLTVAQE